MNVIVVDLVREVVNRMIPALTKRHLAVYYQHGHPSEIVETLLELTQNPELAKFKYPLLALFQDFAEEKGQPNSVAKLKLNLIIAVGSIPNIKAADRYEQTFRPYLIPIYNEFILQIAKSGFFREDNPERIQHTKIDRVFWGRQGLYGNAGNVFADHIDAIEINNMILNVKPKICVP